jgi:hydroxylamine reductase (hybrid-cluster protein)
VSKSSEVDEQSKRAAMNITINTGIGDPNAIAEAIDQVLNDAIARGSLRGVMAV